jgi:hypothetical protein
MPKYRYSALLLKPDTIRLLRLLPNENAQENPQCELIEYTIRDSHTACHPYEALSYVWGGEDKPKSITLDGYEFNVTRNLHTALVHLRDHQIPRFLWVDAVCINQTNEEEKERQILLMAVIFAKASRVIVWLGEARHGSNQALELIREACEKSKSLAVTNVSKKAISRLLDRQWFRRIWVRNKLI